MVGLKKLNVAFVGCGEIANSHMNSLKKIRDLQVVAVCDVDEKKVYEKSREWGVPNYYTNFTEMLEKEDISILSILTPPNFHAPVAIEAIKRGVNVLCEKPLTVVSHDSELIVQTLKSGNTKLTVDYNFLYNKVMSKALALSQNGEIGKILSVQINFLHPSTDPMASDKNHWSHKMVGGRFGEMLHAPHLSYAISAGV